MPDALATDRTVAVVGAGTMGAGIALVAARAGHPVLLHDANAAALERGLRHIAGLLDGQVAKGRIDAATRDAQLGRVRPAATVEELAPAALVIEAVIEDMAIKAGLLRAIEAVVGPSAIIASNTSSLSITALAARLDRPERVAGLHFFNPAPVLPLVEVVSGMATDPAVDATLVETARAWGKAPVRCRSAPGFIVNRVARPFYGEALRLLSEQAADPATIDAVLREGGGFRMGPFELMDLIGHDVNFAVTRTVYEAMFHDRRYLPSLAQQELVDAGWLGRKSGRGFYDYREGANRPAARTAPAVPRPPLVTAGDNPGPARALVARARGAGLNVVAGDAGTCTFALGDALLDLTDGRTATQRTAASGRTTLLFDLVLDYGAADRIALAAPDGCPADALAATTGLFQALGMAVSVVDDAPGLIVARTVAMLANEAADAVHQGTATAADVDFAMTAGVSYPVGPLAWSDRVGPAWIAAVIDNLAACYGEDRYRCSPLLRRRALASARFHPDAA